MRVVRCTRCQMANVQQELPICAQRAQKRHNLYDANERFEIGKCRVIQQSDQDQVCIIAAGITLFEALKAYEHSKRSMHCRRDRSL